ncbi:hypothetical protein N7470_009597 [Penicillium chermesinum]|nr:hypothetical protein N7470_009597 [Penicillium chermesinum]
MSKAHSPRDKNSSEGSDEQWKVDTPFGPPELPHSFSSGSIRRIRNSLSKLSPSALAEKDLLRKKNQYKQPLTRRNVNSLVTAQEWQEACQPNQRTSELQVTEWLEHVRSSDLHTPPIGSTRFN